MINSIFLYPLSINTMSVISFEKLPVTTMTAVLTLTSYININQVFRLLDVTRFEPGSYKLPKKNKLPFCAVQGSIVSASFNGITRGISKGESTKGWRNSIMLDISSSRKNVNIKLSGKSIHMCGSDSEELCLETGQLILDHIFRIQEELNYIKTLSRETLENTINWLRKKCLGQEYYIDPRTNRIINVPDSQEINGILADKTGQALLSETMTTFTFKESDSIDEDGQILDADFNVYHLWTHQQKEYITTYDQIQSTSSVTFETFEEESCPVHVIFPTFLHSIVIPDEYYEKIEGADERVVKFFIKYAPDYRYYEHYMSFIDDVLHIDTVAEFPVAIDQVFPLMVNFSYSLNMIINRPALARCIDGVDGFKAYYNNTTDHCVTVVLPYKPTKEMKLLKKNKANKENQHTFMIYKSGLVTQSGPNLPLVRGAYIKFNNFIRSVADQVRQKDASFTVKFRIKKNRNPYIKSHLLYQPYYFELEDTEDPLPSITKAFGLVDDGSSEFEDFVDLLHMYWDIIGMADQRVDQLLELYEELYEDEKIQFNIINKLFVKALEQIDVKHVPYVLSLGYIVTGQVLGDPEMKSEIDVEDLGEFLNLSATGVDLEIEEQIRGYWTRYMNK